MAPMDPYITERNIDFSITTTEDGGGETTVTDSVDIPRDTSVVQYWLYPTSSTLKITVRVSFKYPFIIFYYKYCTYHYIY